MSVALITEIKSESSLTLHFISISRVLDFSFWELSVQFNSIIYWLDDLVFGGFYNSLYLLDTNPSLIHSSQRFPQYLNVSHWRPLLCMVSYFHVILSNPLSVSQVHFRPICLHRVPWSIFPMFPSSSFKSYILLWNWFSGRVCDRDPLLFFCVWKLTFSTTPFEKETPVSPVFLIPLPNLGSPLLS